MADIKFVHDSGGYIDLMKSGAMKGVLMSYAEGIHASASGALSGDKGTPLEKEPYTVREFEGRDRAGVRVQTNNPHAEYAEVKHGILKGAAGV